jgi:hypothetical protein
MKNGGKVLFIVPLTKDSLELKKKIRNSGSYSRRHDTQHNDIQRTAL